MKLVRSLAALALVALAAVAASPAAAASPKPPELTPVPSDALTRALDLGTLSDADYALERARSLFHRSAVRARYGQVRRASPESATFILRDLRARLGDLSPSERRSAGRVLARPSDGDADPYGDGWDTGAVRRTDCPAGERYCVHWVSTTSDAPPPEDRNRNGTRDWIDTTESILSRVLDKETGTGPGQLGFPLPENDADSTNPLGNPDGKLDVYLTDIGRSGLYGYCASDDPDAGKPGIYHVSAYCVLDNDFSRREFRYGAYGQNANRVTIAHEVHHAEQFALDWLEDIWIMEAGATLMERVVYPGIHDNYQYLASSPITQPGIPIDFGNPNYANVYGDWIFLEYLSERFGGPAITRAIWKKLSARPGRPDQYSIQGVRTVLAARGARLRTVLTNFALANRRYRAKYAIGSSLPRLATPTAASYSLGPAARSRSGTWRSRHLASRWYSFRPRRKASRHGYLRLKLDLPARYTGPEARAVILGTDGKRRFRTFVLNRAGNGTRTLFFGRGKVRRVNLLLTNTSSRFTCWKRSVYSCAGRPSDEGRPYRFTATLR